MCDLHNFKSFIDMQRSLIHNIMRDPRILIIGAGAAGIAAAVKLLDGGFTNVRILEAEGRIGGRINTVEFGRNVVDLGAQWCHGEKGNVVYDYVKNYDLLGTSKCNYKDNEFYESTGEAVDKEVTDMLFGIAAAVTYDYDVMKSTEGSFGNYFIKRYIENVKKEFGSNKKYLEVANKFIHWFHKLILCYDAPPNWFDISASGLLQYKDCDGDPLLNWKDKGYKIFLDVLMKNYPHQQSPINLSSKIILNQEVKTILWNREHSTSIIVHCTDGSTYEADHLIVTVSMGVLKENHMHMFIPELPFYKICAIDGQGFGTVNKIMLKFPHRWWKDEETSFCFLWNEDDRMNILNEFPVGPVKDGRSWLEDIDGFYVIDSDPTILLGWMVGEMAKDVELLDDHIVKKGCMYLLEKFVGENYEIPHPEDVICSRWYSNTHFRGSYSYKSIEGDRKKTGALELSEPLLGAENRPLVLFAGESTHPCFYSTVHGAVETGFREAQRIMEFYKFTLKCSEEDRKIKNPRLRSKY